MNSLASLIFVAKYGLPPRSGWLSSIICRCFLRIISFVMPRSLDEYQHQHWDASSVPWNIPAYGISKTNAASRLFIVFSNPPL